MKQKEIDGVAKELFDVLNTTDRPDIAFALIRNYLTKMAEAPRPEDSLGSGGFAGYVPKTAGQCERCLRMAPQPWEYGETGGTKEEWRKKQINWWDGRAVHMGCTNKCGF